MFAIEVPLATKAQRRPPEVKGESLVQFAGPAGARVLVVEDDPVVLAATRVLLESLGLKVMAATGGVDALA